MNKREAAGIIQDATQKMIDRLTEHWLNWMIIFMVADQDKGNIYWCTNNSIFIDDMYAFMKYCEHSTQIKE